MGLFEVLRHLPRLWRLQMRLRKRLLANPPDLFIGVDAPDFNLPLERYVRKHGIRTVHYVCPSVWAWRSGRVKTIRAACDLVLCLLPFEKDFLAEHGVTGQFVGHPLAEEIPASADRALARQELGLPDGDWVALLPGSRMGEVKYLGPEFVATAAWLLERRPGLRFLVPAASPAIRTAVSGHVQMAGLQAAIKIIDGNSRGALSAADVVLLASGTATLETMLVGRPMVVAYKVSALTAWVLRRSGVVTVDRFSLPNLLADDVLVEEILQEDATGENLGAAVLKLLEDQDVRGSMLRRFEELAGLLRQDANEQAADAVSQLLKI
jgi:lipid-A-disaccharide synthase